MASIDDYMGKDVHEPLVKGSAEGLPPPELNLVEFEAPQGAFFSSPLESDALIDYNQLKALANNDARSGLDLCKAVAEATGLLIPKDEYDKNQKLIQSIAETGGGQFQDLRSTERLKERVLTHYIFPIQHLATAYEIYKSFWDDFDEKAGFDSTGFTDEYFDDPMMEGAETAGVLAILEKIRTEIQKAGRPTAQQNVRDALMTFRVVIKSEIMEQAHHKP